jgi:hypothetical protein
MAGKAVPYDQMSEEATEPTDSAKEEGAEADPAEADPADDDEFMMEAEAAGFTGEKAKAFWRAVARCVELTDSDGGSGGDAVALGGEEEG